MKIQLSEHFTVRKMLRFTLPSVVMMLFTSLYSLVDGLFVSNFSEHGDEALEAITLISPYLTLFAAVGFMVGTGGTALLAKSLGEGDREKANRLFSTLVWVFLGAGVLLAAVGLVFLRPVLIFLGAKDEILDYCILYGTRILPMTPLLILQNSFHNFCAVAEKPRLGLLFTTLAGVTNIALDALLVAGLGMGLRGAAISTAVGQIVGGAVPLVYFLRPNGSLLRLGRTKPDWRAVGRTCVNGSVEMMTNVALAVVGALYDFRLLKYAGGQGVTALTIIMYASFVFKYIFMGYSIGIAPVLGYHYASGNRTELKSLLRKSLLIVGVASLTTFGIAEGIARPLPVLFGATGELLEMTVRGFRITGLMYLFNGYIIFGLSLFAALNRGIISTVLSFTRMLVLQSAAILLLPLAFGTDGIWASMPAAETVAILIMALVFVPTWKRILTERPNAKKKTPEAAAAGEAAG